MKLKHFLSKMKPALATSLVSEGTSLSGDLKFEKSLSWLVLLMVPSHAVEMIEGGKILDGGANRRD